MSASLTGNAPANEDPRPNNLTQDATQARQFKDPKGEAANQPPPMPRVNVGITPPTSQETMIRDVAQSVVVDILKKVTISGVPAQVNGGNIEFTLPKPSATEQWSKQNEVKYTPAYTSNDQYGTVFHPAVGTPSGPEVQHAVRATDHKKGNEQIKVSNLNRDHRHMPGEPLSHNKHHDAGNLQTNYINERRNTLDRVNHGQFGKGHARVLLTRADSKQKIVVDVDIAAGAVVPNGGDDDDTNDTLPDVDSYYFGGFGTKFYCWKAGKLGTVTFGAAGPFKEVTA